MGFFAFVGIDADTDVVAGGFDDFFVAELTVLRCGVAGSKDARDAAALRGDGHKEDGLVGAFCFGKTVFKNGIPGDAGGAELGIGFAEVFGAWSTAATLGAFTAWRLAFRRATAGRWSCWALLLGGNRAAYCDD